MAAKSKIEWTDCTWNPVTGCCKVSPGCLNCYAKTTAGWLQGMRNPSYANGFELTLHPHMLSKPLEWKKSKRIFVNSMSDIFHEDIPLEFTQKVFRIMGQANWHDFQLLTKRTKRLLDLASMFIWHPNFWMGVSVENADYKFRIDHLRSTPAKVKFLSLEPLLGPLGKLNLRGIDWVIAGGESGPRARPMNLDWVREIRDQCQEQDVPFFFKQFGKIANNPDPHDATATKNGGDVKGGHFLDGRLWVEMPVAYQRRLAMRSMAAATLRRREKKRPTKYRAVVNQT